MTPYYKGNYVLDAFFRELLKDKGVEGRYDRNTGEFYVNKKVGEDTIRVENVPDVFSIRVEVKHKEFVDHVTIGTMHVMLYFRNHYDLEEYLKTVLNGFVYSSRVPNEQKDGLAKELIKLFDTGKTLRLRFRPTGIRKVIYLRTFLCSLFVRHTQERKAYWSKRGFYFKSKEEYYIKNLD